MEEVSRRTPEEVLVYGGQGAILGGTEKDHDGSLCHQPDYSPYPAHEAAFNHQLSRAAGHYGNPPT